MTLHNVLEKLHISSGVNPSLLETLHLSLDAASPGKRCFFPSTMPHTKHEKFTRRERQIMELIWRAGRATAGEILEQLPDAPSYSAVRAVLTVLVGKRHLRYEREGKRYVYSATAPRAQAGRSALGRLLATFFDNSASNLVAELLNSKERALDATELADIRALLDEHQRQRRR